MKLVSAIITTFNRCARLPRAINSVLQQTFPDFELLILDNSSSDDTEKVVKSFSDKRIHYIKHSPMPISMARNLGLREAKTDYVAFLDDDDEWLPNKLAGQYTVMAKDVEKKIGLVYGAYVQFNEEGKIYETIYPAKRGDVYEHAVSNRDTLTGSASNPMLRKSAVLAVGGYDESIKTGEDYEMFLRLAKDYNFEAVDVPVLNIYNQSGYRLGWQLTDYLNTEKTTYQKHYDFIKKHPAVEVRYLQILGGKCLRLDQTAEARQFFRQAFAIQPLRPSLWLQFGLSFLPKQVYQAFHRLAVAREHHLRRLKHGR